MKKIISTTLYWLYVPYRWFVLVPVFIVSTILCASFATIASILISPKVGTWGGISWARIVAFFTPMFVKVKNRKVVDKKQSYVIVANHQSMYDIFVLYGWLGIDFKWIMKKELRKAPAIGYASHKVGHLFIDRSSPRAAVSTLQKAKERLINGTSVVVFPEGTRSGSPKMRPFKRGAFKLAFDLELPILPVTIVGSHKIFGRGITKLVPGCTQLIFHEPINVADYREREDELIELTRQTIQQGLN